MSFDSEWSKTLSDAKKVLGSNGKIPTAKMAVVTKAIKEATAHGPAISAAIDVLSKRILDMQNEWTKVKNALREANNEISDDDYNLDPKKPDEKKKIDQVEAMFEKFFATFMKAVDVYVDRLDEVDKHIEHASKFKTIKVG